VDSDQQLLRRIAVGDRDALAHLYHRYLLTVWRYVYASLRGDDQATRDVVSETFLAAMGAIRRTPQHIDSVPAWLTGIARNKLRDARRAAAKMAPAGAPPDPPTIDDPAQGLLTEDARGHVARVMARLDDTDRTVLEWKYLDDLSVHEIAARLNRTEKSVEAMLYRARNAFRALYEQTSAPES
jgi:RNA polymerase sigma-70 factor (ECF subfamily)